MLKVFFLKFLWEFSSSLQMSFYNSCASVTFSLVYNQIVLRPLPLILFQSSQSLNMLEGEYFEQRFFKGFSMGHKIQALILNIKGQKNKTVISVSDLTESCQTMNTDRAKSFAKCYKKLSNSSTGRQKFSKILSSRCSSYTILQLPSLTLRYKNYISKTTLQYGLQRLSKLFDMAANYLCFFFFANLFTS